MTPISVLVVQHDAVTRDAIKSMLDRLGCLTIRVSSTDFAIGALRTVVFNLMLFSSTRDDIEVEMVALRAKVVQPRVKVIFLTGSLPARQLSAVDLVLQTPFEIDMLEDAIREVVGHEAQRNSSTDVPLIEA